MRRIIFASAAAAVLASSTGCQQCWDSFRRFEAWKFQSVFGTSPDAYAQVVAMPATVAQPICEPINAYAPAATIASPATILGAPSGCACSGTEVTTIPSLPATTLQSTTTIIPNSTITPIPGPAVQ